MEEDDELFEVECFLNTRVKDGKRFYKVRWQGFPPEEDTWEPEENVLECEEVLEAFWRKRKRNANRRQKIRRYRLMSEEEDQDTASTSRENKATNSFGDIEPLGLTRQASKELAMCLNKTRKTKRNSESSSQAGSDVTLTENDVLLPPSSQSTPLYSQPGSDVTASDNELFSHIKSSETGSDVLNRSTESTNESNPPSDVINVSSQESLDESDLECSPRQTLDKNKESKGGKTNKVEIISLLSDSEDNENDGTGSQQCGTQSPHVLQSPLDVSRDSSPVIGRESFKTPETTPSKFFHSIETPESEKITSLKQSPSTSRENEEDPSIFGTPVRRKNRFELSLKKNRRKSLSKNESSASGSPKTEEDVLNVGVRKRDVFSDENLVKTKEKAQLQLLKERMMEVEISEKIEEEGLNVGVKKQDVFSDENLVKTKEKTQLQLLKESMIEVENSEKILEKSDSKIPEISEPKAKTTLIEEKESNESSMIAGDVCPTISELKGIMHKIARNKHQQHVEASLSGTETDGIKNQGSSEDSALSSPDISEAKTSETMSCRDDSVVDKMLPEDNVAEKEIELNFCNSGVSERMLVEDEAEFTLSERESSVEDRGTSKNDGEELNSMKSLSETEEKLEDENIENVEENIINHMSEAYSLEKGVDLKHRSEEEEENSIRETISEKDQEKKEDIRTLALVPSSSKKALVLTSETTSRVLKNLRFLAAKTRESKSIETTMNVAVTEKKNDDTSGEKVESESDLGITNAGKGNTNWTLEEELIGIGNNLNENENKFGKEIEGIVDVEEGNKTEEADEKKKKGDDELGLMNARIKPIDDQNVKADKDIISRVEDTSNNKCTEIYGSEHQTEKMLNIESFTDEKTKPAIPETKQVSVPHSPELSRSGCDSFSRIEKDCGPNDKMSADIPVVDGDSIMSFDSEICTNISTTKTSSSLPGVQSLSIHEATSTQGCQGDDGIEEKLTQNFQKHNAVERRAAKQKGKQSEKPRKMLKKGHEKTTPGKRAKRKKLLQSNTNKLNSKSLNSNQDIEEETDVSSSSMKLNLRKAKRTKAKKRTKITKTEESNSTMKNLNPPLQDTREEQTKKNLILDANFSSSLTSGDLIGAIIDEGDRENTLKNNQIKSSAAENSNSEDVVAARQEEDMMIEDDEDFDFELEDFPLEKLLQEEDDIDIRYIPSPPAEPMEVPFASVKTAIRDGDEMTVRAALAGGLELDTLDGASGMTLLMLAAASGQDGVVELLLRRKADVNAGQKNGMTALMHACEQGYPETAHVLLLCGADINKQQIAGETALMKACKKGHTDVVEVLLRNGADTRMESKSGHTAQQFAIRGFLELSSLIEEHEKRLGRVVEEAILKCLGDTVTLCKPAILSLRCAVPREGQQMTLPFHYSPQLYNKEVDVILFCIKAVFDDVVSLLFGEDNGVRGVLLNNKPQIPILHGIRSIFSIDPKSRQNTITLQTHKCSNPASRIILCIYAVQSKS